jgi:hypothetical protein
MNLALINIDLRGGPGVSMVHAEACLSLSLSFSPPLPTLYSLSPQAGARHAGFALMGGSEAPAATGRAGDMGAAWDCLLLLLLSPLLIALLIAPMLLSPMMSASLLMAPLVLSLSILHGVAAPKIKITDYTSSSAFKHLRRVHWDAFNSSFHWLYGQICLSSRTGASQGEGLVSPHTRGIVSLSNT